jgi:hypothetical protein
MSSQAARLRQAIRLIIAYELCGECGNGCIAFYNEKPCYTNEKPCKEVSDLLSLVWPEFDQTPLSSADETNEEQ